MLPTFERRANFNHLVVVFREAEMRLIGCWQWYGRFTAERHYCHRYVQGVETLLDLGMFDVVIAQVEVPRLVTVAQVSTPRLAVTPSVQRLLAAAVK